MISKKKAELLTYWRSNPYSSVHWTQKGKQNCPSYCRRPPSTLVIWARKEKQNCCLICVVNHPLQYIGLENNSRITVLLPYSPILISTLVSKRKAVLLSYWRIHLSSSVYWARNEKQNCCPIAVDPHQHLYIGIGKKRRIAFLYLLNHFGCYI